MKGWCRPALKVLTYAFGAVVGGLCLAFGIGLLLAGPASAATQAPAGLGGSLISAVSGTASSAVGAVASTAGTVTSAAAGTVSAAAGAASPAVSTVTAVAAPVT